MVAVAIAMSLNNAFSKKKILDLNVDDISLQSCGLCHILEHTAEVDCNQKNIMRNGLYNYDVAISLHVTSKTNVNNDYT